MTTEPKPKPVYLDNTGYPEPKQGIENTECPSGCFFADFYHVVHVPSCSLFQHRSGEPIDEVMHRISHAEDDMQCHGYLDPVRKEIAALRAQLAENKREIAELAALVPALATERAARERAEERVKELEETLFEIEQRCDHQIPPYAYADNGAACEFVNYLRDIAILAARARKEGGSR